MKVIGIKAENIKRLKIVSLDVNGENLIVSGPPGEGKTTLISLVWAALTKKDLGPRPVRQGQESGFIEIKLGGEEGKKRTITVRRDYDADGTDRLKVKASDGSKIGITDIQRLIQSISFDPLEFYTKKGVEQVNMLLRILGVDLGDIDSRRKSLYEERTAIGRIARAARDAMGAEPPKCARVSVAELSSQFTDAVEFNRVVDDRHATLSGLKSKLAADLEKVAAIRAELDAAQAAADALALRIKNGEIICAGLVKKDITALQNSIRSIEETNQRAENYSRWVSDSEKAATYDIRYKELDESISKIDSEKEKLLAGAKWPVPGLNVDGDVVLYENVPLVQAGEGKKLEISFAIAATLNPELRICRIDGAESLGAGGRTEILRIAQKEDMQVFMSRVADGEAEEGEITIEEGVAVR
jgi:hypothetical protein